MKKQTSNSHSAFRIPIPEGCEIVAGDPVTGENLEIVDKEGAKLNWFSKNEANKMLDSQMEKYYNLMKIPDLSPEVSIRIKRLVHYVDGLKANIKKNRGIFMEEKSKRFLPC